MKTFTFGPFRLVPHTRTLLEDNVPVAISGRAFDILVALVGRAGETLSKAQLLETVWPDTTVEETNLRVHMSALRKVLKARDGGYVASVPQKGYCFVAAVEETEADETADDAAPRVNATREGRSQLPALLTRVIGRDDTVLALKQQVRTRRFVTIVGPAGIGKSTVALAIAEQLAGDFADGCHFVDLVSLLEPRLVPTALAGLFDVSIQTEDPIAGLIQSLRHKELLLVLDNCEHLIASVATLSERLLMSVPGLALLATSREAMRARGEWVSRLPALDYPDSSAELTASDALQFSAVELFVERAVASAQEFVLTDADASVVADLCSRLDGIPLAIELAAARVGTFSLRELAARFDDRYRLLMQGRRTALPRHQTLRGAMDWSYDALSSAEQAVLCRLAIFPGAFDPSAAAAVTAGDGLSESEVSQQISELAAKSLVALELRSEHARCRLLATTRAYALEKLTDSGQLAELQRRHAEFVCGRVEQLLSNAGRLAAAAALPLVLDDIRAALHWAYGEGGDLSLAIALTAVAVPLVASFSLHAEFREYLTRALAAASMLDPPDQKTKFVLSIAQVGLSLHTHAQPEAMLAQSLELAEALGDEASHRIGIEVIWATKFGRGDYPGCLETLIEWSEVVAVSRDPGISFDRDRALGVSLHFSGQHETARPLLTRALEYFASPAAGAVENPVQVPRRVSCSISLARTLWLQGEWVGAIALASEALEKAFASGHRIAICYALGFAACPLAIWRGDRIEATRLVGLLARESTRSALPLWQNWARCYEAVLESKASPPSEPNEMQREMLCTCREALFDPGLLARVEAGFAGWCAPEVLRASGESLLRQNSGATGEAEALFRRALALGRQQGARFWELRTATSLARLWRDQGEFGKARRLLEPLLPRFGNEISSLDLETSRALLVELS